ncbi:aspartic peptidase domain-containing protein [Xylaria sp. CBS 124048]|nr:aspartic peptidase domain-containing protein [Xylaria sp. CBS 124048]
MPSRLIAFLYLVLAVQNGDTLATTPRSRQLVKLPVVHSSNREVFGEVHDEKRDVITEPLIKRSDVAYYAQLEIGTPPQPILVQLDTGSFELWVNPDCSNLRGSSDASFCRKAGHYDPSTSSSAVPLSLGKNLTYGIGKASIQYVLDTVSLAGSDAHLRDVKFGVAFDTVDEFSGILGIGHGENATIPYKNIVDQLADQGVTNTKAFSLVLGSKSEKEGAIIFGGLDTSKFSGSLKTQRIISAGDSPDQVQRYRIDMESLSITAPNGTTKIYTNASIPVILDSGSTLTLFPTRLADAIAANFGANTTDDSGLYRVDCRYTEQPGTVDFAFKGVTIRVPYREVIREAETEVGSICYLGIGASEQFALLGDSMLRSAYVVFDQTNNAIHLAQYSNCGSNDVEITADMHWGSVTGDCEAPNPGSADAESDPAPKKPQPQPQPQPTDDGGDGSSSGDGDGDGAGAGPSEPTQSGTWRWEVSGLGPLSMVLAAFHGIDIAVPWIFS